MKKKNILIASTASLVVLASVAYLIIRRRTGSNRPPARAPQVPVQNPGDQSNFPAGPSGEMDLG